MIEVTVKVIGHLTKYLRGNTIEIQVRNGSTVRELLKILINEYGEEFGNEIMTPDGNDLAPYYKILIDGRNVKLISDFNTILKEGQVIIIMPPIAGG
jgi:molybdopterin synthase sulfur carrier subunit